MEIRIIVFSAVSILFFSLSLVFNWKPKAMRGRRICNVVMSGLGLMIGIISLEYVGDKLVNISSSIIKMENSIVSVQEYNGTAYLANSSVNINEAILISSGGNNVSSGPNRYAFANIKNLTSKTDWMKSVNANPGDEITIRLEYINYNQSSVEDVYCDIKLPKELELIPDSLILYNIDHPNGIRIERDSTELINLGDYVQYGKSLLFFNISMKEDITGIATTIYRTEIIIHESGNNTSEDFVDLNVYYPYEKDTWRQEHMG